MNKRKLLSALSVILVFCLLLGVGPMALEVSAAETLVTLPGGHSQTHTAGDTLADIQAQNAQWSVRQFLNQCATPLDGSNGNPDLCVPGLSSTDNMIPQGMTYYRQKNWVLVASYYNGSGKSSVVYAMSLETGKFVAQFNILNNDGSACTAHVGGIAASDHNLYIADKGNTISYVPLSELAVEEGTVKDITIQGTVALPELGSASTSFCSIDNGILWTGNFYHIEGGFNVAANSKYNSMVFGYTLQGGTSETEWNAFATGSIIGSAPSNPKACAGYPSYSIAIPNAITKIQCAVVSHGRIYIGTSYGRKNACDLYIADVDLTKDGDTDVTIAGHAEKAYLVSDYKTFQNHLYMNEGMFMLNNELYILTESAAYKYYGESNVNKCTYPTDVVWKLDPYALVGEVAPGESGTTSYYQRVNTWGEINDGDEYIILFKSSAKADNGNQILYTLNAKGGYNDTSLPKYTAPADAKQDTTGDTMGMVGKAITEYTFTNGDRKLVLNNADDDVESIRWSIEKTGTGNGVRITSKDSYFSNAPYLYYGSRLIYMTIGANSQFEKIYLTSVNEANGTFKLYYNGSKEYWMFCNDGTIDGAIANYTATYASNSNSRPYKCVYDGCSEVPGTFHMDGGFNRRQADTGNMVGGTNKGKAVADSYGYFNIYKRIVKTSSSQGKSNLFTGKKAYASADGTYTIDLEAYATGERQSAISDKGVPLDVIMVLDLSASMSDASNNQDCINYDKNYRLSYNGYRPDSKDTFYKVGDTYYKIERGSYQTQEYVAHNGDISRDGLKGAGTTWYYLFDGEYCALGYTYYRKNDSGLYSYDTAVISLQHNGNYYALYNTGIDCNCSNKGTSAHEAAHLIGTSMPDRKKGHADFRNSANTYYNCYKSSSSKANYNGVYYTYETITHYYLYYVKDGVTYYLDGTGASTERPSKYTTSGEYSYTGAYYVKTNVTRQTAVTKAAKEFLSDLKIDAGKYDVDHRMALVTFGNDNSNARPITNVDSWKYTGVWKKNTNANAAPGEGSIVKKNDANIQDAYNNAFYSANDPTVEKGIDAIDGMRDSYVCAAPNHGLEMAYNILESSNAKSEYENGTRKAIVVFISDGVPGNPSRGDNPNIAKIYAHGAIQQAKKIKDSAKADIYSIYIGTESMSGFDVNSYMAAVSSNYPNATGYPGYNYTVGGVNYTGELGEQKSNAYYSAITSGGDLSRLLESISYEAIASGTAVNLNRTAVLKDVLSDNFSFPSDLSEVKITLQTQELSYDASNKLVEGAITDAPAGITYSISGNEVNVTGFDYTQYYVAPDHAGKRLLVKIEGVIPNSDISGYNVDTNDNERSGIYAHQDDSVPAESLTKEDVTKLLPAPDTDVPVYNYVFDFGSTMPITALANELMAVTTAPQKLDSSNYPLSVYNERGGEAQILPETNAMNLTMGLEESYIYCFVKTHEDGVYQWIKANLIPASNVYYEESSFAPAGDNTSWTVDGNTTSTYQDISSANDLYGFDSSYNNNSGADFSGGSALKATVNSTNKFTDKLSFAFNGNSFDLISACGPTTGVLAVKVYNKEMRTTKMFVVDTYYTDTDYLINGLAHQVPVMTFSGDYGTYIVEISGLYLNSAGAVKNAATKAKAARYLAVAPKAVNNIDDEITSALKELGYDEFNASNVEKVWMDDNSILNGGTGSSTARAARKVRAANGIATNANDATLTTYVDAVRIYKPLGPTDSEAYADGEKNATYINVLTNLKSSNGISGATSDGYFAYVEGKNYESLDFADYNNYKFGGPHNEIYLSPVSDGDVSGLTFKIANFDRTKSQVMLSMRYVLKNGNADGATCKINGNIVAINSATELYYDISQYIADDGTVTIQNLGGNLLAIDYLKLADAKLGVDDSLAKPIDLMSLDGVESDILARFKTVEDNYEDETDDIDRPLGIVPLGTDDSGDSGMDFSFIDSVVVILNKIIELILNISKVPW